MFRRWTLAPPLAQYEIWRQQARGVGAMRGIFLGGTASGVGKTTAALGLIGALKGLGRAVQAAKAGPDFLDAGWLGCATGRPCPNVDPFMAPAGRWQRPLRRFLVGADFLVVEGAMGLYDGDEGGAWCGAALAEALGLPVLLLLNGQGMGQSVAAMALGFLQYDIRGCPRQNFCGLVCTRVGSARHERMLTNALRPVCANLGVPLLGMLPTSGAPSLASRHLGLVQACEKELDLDAFGRWFSEHVDMVGIWRRSGRLLPRIPAPLPPHTVTVAIARDEAFGFCYADLPLMLAELGAKVVYFSPLRDATPPPCDGIYIPGGYPELYGERLSSNGSMLAAVRSLGQAGMPIYGECGGYMYLLEYLVDGEGRRWPMAGLLPGGSTLGRRFAALGYRTATGGWLKGIAHGHEFHYARGGAGMQPLWALADSRGEPVTSHSDRRGNVFGSWVHLYPEGSGTFWVQWLELVRGRRVSVGSEGKDNGG